MRSRQKRSTKDRASLDLLYSVSRELASHLDLVPLLARVLKLTLETVGGEHGSIVVLDERGKAIEGTYFYEGKLHEHTATQLSDTLVGGLAGWVVEHREAALISNVLEDARWLKRDFEIQEKLKRSAICVPIMTRGRVVGVLTLVHPEEAHFTQDDLYLLNAISDQGGMAIDNARLFSSEQKRRIFASTLQEITRIVNASLDPSQVYPLILEQLERVIDYDSASIFLHEGDRLRLVAAEGFSEDITKLGFSLPDDESLLVGQVLHNMKTMFVKDVQSEEGWIRSEDIPETSMVRGWIGTPLIVQDKAVGILTVDRHEPSTFEPDELEIVAAFAHQTSTAVANAQFYAQSQRQMKAMVALAETARVVSASLDLSEVLQRILSQTMGTLDIEAASLALIDDVTGDLEFKVASGSGSESMIGIRLARGEGIAGWVVEHGEPIIVKDVQSDSRFYPEVDQQIGFKTHALACVPIQVKEEIKGVLEAINPRAGAFEPHQLEILMGIAGLAGTAIEHARLFTETQAARQRYAGLFDDSIDPILISDLEGRITDANYHAQGFLGRDSESLVDSQVRDLHIPLEDHTVPNFKDLLPGVALSYEANAKHLDGTLLPVEVHVKRIDVERQPVLQWMMRDISERKALDELRTDLTSMLFHDLRSPLGNVISSLEVMKTSIQEDDEEMEAIISVAQRSSRRLSRLIDSLLDISSLESGTAVLHKSHSSITDLLQETLEEVQPIADAKGQLLALDGTGESLPGLEVDQDMIRRVLINLAENAIKYTPSNGSITISVAELNGEIRVGVEDTGPGIDPKDHKKIFEKFARVERKGRSKGLGLGLAFCRLAVEAHGGKIWVEGGPKQGSIFYLRCQYNSIYPFQFAGSKMNKITSDVFIEKRFPAVHLGLISIDEKVLLVDCPIRLEDGRSWLKQASEYGKPLYTALLDHHPDRMVGARDLTMPLVGHTNTSQIMAGKSDSFKGNAHPIGAETDKLKRVTGVSRSIPNLAFTDEMTIRMGDGEVEFWYRPGPAEGAIWVVYKKGEVIFIGDGVTVAEPPFLGEAELDAWLETLDDMRSFDDESFQLVSSRDGLIEREDINVMARFLRKVRVRIERLGEIDEPEYEFDSFAGELLDDFDLTGTRKERARLRLRVGLEDLYQKTYDIELE